MSAKALQALLSDETAAESRVYAIRIPQRSEYPAITYQQIDIVVEESANGGSTAMRLREADLDRHLSNDRDKDAGKEPVKPEAKAKSSAKPGKDKNGKDEVEEELPQRLEYASKSDYQLQQALNLLKGLQIMQNKVQ